MTKLRYDRPILRYLDNVAREHRMLQAKDGYAVINPKLVYPEKQYLHSAKNEGAYERVISSFDDLSASSQGIIGEMLSAGEELIAARTEQLRSMKTLTNSKKITAVSLALDNLRAVCVRFNIHCRESSKGQSSPARQWWAKLRASMGPEWAHFDEIDDMISATIRA